MKTYFSIFLWLTVHLVQNVNSEGNDNLLFSVVSTTKPPSQNDRMSFEELQNFKTLNEVKYFVEKVDLRVTEMQKTLDRLEKLFDTKLNNNWSPQEEDRVISKIDKILNEKLKLHNINICEKSQSEEEPKQIFEFKSELQQVKLNIITEIKEQQKEQTKVLNGNLEKMQREITDKIVSQIQIYDSKLNSQLEKVQKQIVDEFEKIPEKAKLVEDNNLAQQNAMSSTTIKPDNLPRDCKEIYSRGDTVSKVYIIQPSKDIQPFEVVCDMDTRGGGWIYVLKRFDGTQNFNLNWTEYKQGFGNLNGEFWLGLEHLYQLTHINGSELLFELTDWEEKTVAAYFKTFRLSGEVEDYSIKDLKEYSGNAGSSFLNHVGNPFSTLDRRGGSNSYCVEQYNGPWWYGSGCFHVKLTGRYLKGNILTYADGIHWSEFHGFKYSLKKVKMMVRPWQ